jgi:hypothetical protein
MFVKHRLRFGSVSPVQNFYNSPGSFKYPQNLRLKALPTWGDIVFFDDDGRWLQISGSIICIWTKPKDRNDGDFLYGYGFEIKVSTIDCEGNSYSEEGRHKTRGLSAYFSGPKDFVGILAIVCADNANLCPVIDRYFSSIGKRSSLNGSYVLQQPLVGAMKPYLMTQAKRQRK